MASLSFRPSRTIAQLTVTEGYRVPVHRLFTSTLLCVTPQPSRVKAVRRWLSVQRFRPWVFQVWPVVGQSAARRSIGDFTNHKIVASKPAGALDKAGH
jgi:hypothetical protein